MLLFFSSMSFLLWDTILEGLICHGFSLKISVLQEQLQTGSFPWSTVLQEWTAQLGPLCVTNLARKRTPAWAPLPGLQLLKKTCSCVGYPGSAASSRHPGAMGLSHALWFGGLETNGTFPCVQHRAFPDSPHPCLGLTEGGLGTCTL